MLSLICGIISVDTGEGGGDRCEPELYGGQEYDFT